VFDLPAEPPVIAVAAGGPQAAEIAAEYGDGLFATEPRIDLVGRYHEAGGDGPRYAEVTLAWAPDEEHAVAEALEKNRSAVTGWKVMSELPNPVNFDAASRMVREEDIRRMVTVGPDPAMHADAVARYAHAGFDHIALMNVGPDPDGFLDFFESDLVSLLR
jgi:G6PDH family F420-dependent oxidoreductase